MKDRKLVRIEGIELWDFVLERLERDHFEGMKKGAAQCTLEEWIGDVLLEAFERSERLERWEKKTAAERLSELEWFYDRVSEAVGELES